MKCVIDSNSGFCSGVITAIRTAEQYLSTHPILYCLGDIVHNNEEVDRLTGLGLIIISHEEFRQLRNTTVLIRAHGEPPETYAIATQNHIRLIDATCPVVLKLQQKVKMSHEEHDVEKAQILIFGKEGHAEVIGLLGQTSKQGMVISGRKDLDKIDYERPAYLYSQTTQSIEDYSGIVEEIASGYRSHGNGHLFYHHNTICRLVANRSKQIREFASLYDKIIFVSGEKSSNGLYLFGLCKEVNPNSYFISNKTQLDDISIEQDETIGICGATSTPMWLMEEIRDQILKTE